MGSSRIIEILILGYHVVLFARFLEHIVFSFISCGKITYSDDKVRIASGHVEEVKRVVVTISTSR